MIKENNTMDKNMVIPAYDFHLPGILKPKDKQEEIDYIKTSTLFTGIKDVSEYLTKQINKTDVSKGVKFAFTEILKSKEALSKLDIVSDGSYRCNRILYYKNSSELVISGGNRDDWDKDYLGSNRFHGKYFVSKEGIANWIKDNERLFIQETDSSFIDSLYDNDDDGDLDNFYEEKHKALQREDVLNFIKEEESKNVIPIYNNYNGIIYVTLEEYEAILTENGYSKYVF